MSFVDAEQKNETSFDRPPFLKYALKQTPENLKSWQGSRRQSERDIWQIKKQHRLAVRILGWFIRKSRVLFKIAAIRDFFARRALNLRIERPELYLDYLPAELDGLKILHLSDLHLDNLPGIEESIIKLISDLEYDVSVITGDIRDDYKLPFNKLTSQINKIGEALHPKTANLAILGNHDSQEALPILEANGIQVLINEVVTAEVNGAPFHITGLDDVNCFKTEQAFRTLSHPLPGFKILLVHSPDVVREAINNGFDLYLCGHTHGGQICLPGGIALFTHSRVPRKFTRGLWKESKTQGYTSRGAGVSTIAARINCPGEVALITLRTKRPE